MHIKNKVGAITLEFVVAVCLFVPILMVYMTGGYNYYMAQSQNISLNYEAGRYFSTMSACNKEQIYSIQLNPRYAGYDIEAVINGVSSTKTAKGESQGVISITCTPANWSSGTNFGVSSEKYFNSVATNFPFFPKTAYKGGRYVVE